MAIELTIPNAISRITNTLAQANFSAYLVGGCVRDLLMGKVPKDWDVATDAKPEQITSLFPKTFYENAYGTVTVVNDNETDISLRNIEVTPFREEAKYSDKRHPDKVTFSKTIEEDIGRRDFTINALAYESSKRQIIDLYNGQADIKDKVVRAVGQADDRFDEDPLRIMRGVRLASELGFMINEETSQAIKANAPLLQNISKERIRDEFIKIIMSDRPMESIILSHELGILKIIIPDLESTIGVEQNQAHSFDVWFHLLKSLNHAVKKKMSLDLRLAALFHDISKPETRRWSPEKKDWTFYGHDVVGAKRAAKILKDLRFPNELIEKVEKLVRWHMFFSDTEQITLSAVRRLIVNVGKENIWDLMNVRICDRIGTGRPKESPYRLRKYRSMIDEVLTDPISVGMLKIDGSKVIRVTKMPPGPKIGHILHALLEEVLEDPSLNTEEYLENKAVKLAELPENELKAIGEKAKEKKESETEKKITEIRDKHWVK